MHLLFFLILNFLQISPRQNALKQFYNYLPKIEKSKGGILDNVSVIEGDFDRDGLRDVIIQFTIVTDGGAGHILAMGAAFYKNTGNNNVKVVAGYEPGVLFSVSEIRNGLVYITQSIYGPKDPLCCPSFHKDFKLKYQNGKVYELK